MAATNKECLVCGATNCRIGWHAYATNAGDGDSGVGTGGEVKAGGETEGVAGVTGQVSGRTKNRRSREAYNAYQREYMRKYRSTKGA